MKRASSLLFLCLFLSPGASFAQKSPPPKISVSVNPDPLIAGEPFQLEISIETQGTSEPDIRLPRFGGLHVLRQFESHPSSFSFSFGFGGGATQFQKSQSNYTFVLMADKPGTYTIDPIFVTVDNQKFKGNTYKLQVLKGSSSPSGSGSGNVPGGIPGGIPGGLSQLLADPNQIDDDSVVENPPNGSGIVIDSLDGAKIDPDFFVQTAVSKKEVYVGEMLTMTIYLYMARNISNYDILREPGTEGFWGENLIPSTRRNLDTEAVTVQGRAYDRAVLRQLALFPIKPGTLTISPTSVEVGINQGFFARPKVLKRSSLPVPIKVLDLPADGQPLDFNPANVGKYTFSATIDTLAVKVGEPVTLTMTVNGEGNLRNLVLPKVPEIDGLKVYEPENETDISPKGLSIIGTTVSRVLMIPNKPGKFVIPEIKWSYFDPDAAQYKTLTAPSQTIDVSGSSEKQDSKVASSANPEAVTKVGQDRLNRRLRSIVSRADLSRKSEGHPLTRPWFLLLVIGVPLIYIGVVMGSRTRRKLAAAKLKNRSKNADGAALKKLAELKKTMKEASAEKFFSELQRCLLVFIEERLDDKVIGDTMAELRDRLVSRGFSAEQAESVIAESESCDFARFARQSSDNAEREHMLLRMEKIVRDLSKVNVLPLKKEKRQ
jgi:hypothetical protein